MNPNSMNKHNLDGTIIYQVYPRSFFDSNNDGIGDLAGIYEKLDYIKRLGVDYLWISPIFKSPMKDFGYDISDYNAIDPIFGQIADFKKLMLKANKLNLKIMLDMVLCHCSIEHSWLKQASKDSNSPYHDWFIWADSKKPTQPTNNWLSVFGGSAWSFNSKLKKFYLHKFLKEQPNLNFYNPDVQKAMLDVCEFWLKLGVKGLRLDTVNYYFHDSKLRNNPILKDNAPSNDAPDANPYGRQNHIYDKNQKINLLFLQKLRKLSDRYDAILLGEVGAGNKSTKIMKEYTTSDKLNICYSFDFMGDELKAKEIKKLNDNFWKGSKDSMIAIAFGNHDTKRIVSRYPHKIINRENLAKLVFTVSMFLKGAKCIYQGEELALTEYNIKKNEIQDPYGLAFYPKFKGRDGCRTPFIWSNKTNGGFSNAKKTWLPVPKEHLQSAVESQINYTESVLNFYKSIINFSKKQPALNGGEIKVEAKNNNLLTIHRKKGIQKLTAIFNLTEKIIELELDSNILLSNNYKKNSLLAFGFVITKT